MPHKHVVISGTGRAGTTFLVQLLTRLGLETGFTCQTMDIDQNARAGLEHDLRESQPPYIVKSPWFIDYAEEVLTRTDMLIEHVFIPMRDLRAAAESRRYVAECAEAKLSLLGRLRRRIKPVAVPGGLWHTRRARQQEQILSQQFYKLALALSAAEVPVTLLRYPRLVRDSAYLHKKLAPILGTISYARFQTAFEQTVRPDWVHSFSDRDY
jgi:hypothetical protein